jgi:hypothetical protein
MWAVLINAWHITIEADMKSVIPFHLYNDTIDVHSSNNQILVCCSQIDCYIWCLTCEEDN